MKKIIWTIGHSTRAFEEFVEMLRSFQIDEVVDIRSFPGSRKFPQYNKEILAITLPEMGIQYTHLRELGGRRKINKESKFTVWRVLAFRAYADYMETDAFKAGIVELEKLASGQRIAYMCSEAVWWRCHRSMVSDYLKVRGWEVLHIMAISKEEEHPYTGPAKVIDGELYYGDERLL
ncbi:MAG: DUF488 domain-containing protein [Ginsengibacter sp.]